VPITVLVPGKFAVLHAGHIRIFRYAKEIGQRVIAALDISGLSQSEIRWRFSALSSLEYVEKVETFEGTVANLVLHLKPEIVLKGKEFEGQDNIELDVLNSYGGKLLFSSGTSFYSGDDFVEFYENRLEQDLNNSGKDYTLRNNIKHKSIISIIDNMKNLRTCIIGDIIVDEIISCHPVGMSQEDPTIVATPIESSKFIGGAGIVSGHCEALGSKTTLVTVLGNDELSIWCRSQFGKASPKLVIFEDPYRKTTLKQRFKSGKQVLFKLNHFTQNSIQKPTEEAILDFFKKEIENFDLIIFSDFSYGVVTDRICREIISMAKSLKIPVMADSQTSSQVGNLSKFLGANLVTPTEREARNEIRDDSSGLAVVAQKTRALLNTQFVLLKLGADGVLLDGIDENGDFIRTDLVPALNKNPVDVSGAGDSMLAGAALTLASGNSIYIAAYIGSIMSAIQVSRIGNIPISKDEIKKLIR
jgi:rfaE bifunctional protein kinase chain/domain